ncbi:MAG: response regulator [Deltaproteobacteria bacterium]|nr:response regulator [Deltaproteobacteria bacterium]
MNQPTPKALILVVEDNDDVRDIVTTYLRRNGYAVSEASDGQTAVDAFSSINPNLVLLDVLLPKVDGIEVLKQLRQSDTGKRIPVVMMSAVLQTRDLKSETARLNVSSFLQKPFQMRSLMEHVEAALNISQKVSSRNAAPAAQSLQSGWKAEKRLQMSRKPIVSPGRIEELPVPEILHAIFIESYTGRLQICSGATEKRIFFQNGLPVYAESSIPEETLGSHLARNGRLTQEQHAMALDEMTSSGRHFGEVLLKLELLGPHELFTELEAHLTEKVISTFAWHEGTYHFEEGDSWKDDVIVARMKPGRILIDGVQHFWTPGSVQKRLRITDLSRTFPLDASPYSEEQLGLSTQETRILQMVRRGLAVGDIVRQIRDLNIVTSTLYALFVMEYLGFVLATPRDSVSSGAPTADKTNTQSSKDQLAKVLLAEYLKFRTADYFKLLGVSRNASAEDIRQAFEKRKKRYHPDTLIGIDTGLVHEKIEELYVRIHNAYRTLVDPETRRQYLEQIDGDGAGAPMSSQTKTGPFSTIENKPEDERLFEKGFSCLRSGDYKGAHSAFTKATEIEPKPRYEAHVAWVAYLIDARRQKVNTEKVLMRLHKENKNEALYPYLLGNLALKEKDKKRATQFFERAIRIDPQHIDSARQLRILRMRQQSSEVSGLFEIFKKK